jgi:hypothetical protein
MLIDFVKKNLEISKYEFVRQVLLFLHTQALGLNPKPETLNLAISRSLQHFRGPRRGSRGRNPFFWLMV